MTAEDRATVQSAHAVAHGLTLLVGKIEDGEKNSLKKNEWCAIRVLAAEISDLLGGIDGVRIG